MKRLRRWLAVFCLSGLGLAAQAQQGTADAQVDRVRLEQRLAAVETLIERSSGAQQIEASGAAPARERRAKAREIYRQARKAYDGGQLALASQLLPQASVEMFEAVRLAAPEQITAPKARTDFDARLETVNSLFAAFRRVAAEKTAAPGTAETSRDIERRIAEAQRLTKGGNLEAGRAELDRAYLLTKAAVSALRSGDTLVRSLEFANKEEEYRYEIDRNDTHQMLIKVLLDGKPETAQTRGFIDRAAKLRAQADGVASRRDHAAAIQLLEESTRELVRAIRGAGIYIPG
jgi:hypothetical protein